jgi:hypothetical protein
VFDRELAEHGWSGAYAELAEKSGRFFDEFDWYMRAMKAEREQGRALLGVEADGLLSAGASE